MTRKTSVLFALVALFAIGAISASAASASQFRSSLEEETTLFGGQHQNAGVFGNEYGQVKCAEANYGGTMIGDELATLELTSSYTGCSWGFGTATVKMNNCMYALAAGAIDEKGNFEGWISLVCPAGVAMTIETFIGATKSCTITIWPQNELKTVTYTNKADAELNFYLEIEVGIKGLAFTQDPGAGAFKCPAKEGKTGTFTSLVTLRAKKPGGGAADLWIE